MDPRLDRLRDLAEHAARTRTTIRPREILAIINREKA